MARVRQHREKYQVLYRDPATKRERSAGVFTKKSDALRFKRRLEYELETDQWIDPTLGSTAFSPWAREWLSTRAHLKPKTREGYESLLNSQVLPAFGDSRLKAVRPLDVDRWVSEMETNGLSASRIRQAVSLFKLIMDAAVRNLMIARNPAEGVNLPKKTPREMQYLNGSEIERLADAVPERYSTLVYVLAYCGLSAGEATALKRARVNLLQSELLIAEAATEVHGALIFGETKNRAHRTVALPKFVREALDSHMHRFTRPQPDSLVFSTDEGTPLRLSNFRNRVWKPALHRAELNDGLRIHDLRHTAASLLITSDIHPKVVQEHLGHSSITTTMDRYGHLYPEARIKVAEALDSLHTDSASG